MLGLVGAVLDDSQGRAVRSRGFSWLVSLACTHETFSILTSHFDYKIRRGNSLLRGVS